MDDRRIERTGVQVRALCLECMRFGRRTDEADAIRMLDRSLQAGITCLDTATIYPLGRSEEIVGTALKRNGQ